jgi:transmembrane sensor
VDDEQLQILLAKYKNGSLNEEESQQLQAWLDEQGEGMPGYVFESESQEQQLKKDIQQEIKKQLFLKPEPAKVVNLRFWARIAAVLVLISGLAVWGVKHFAQPAEAYTTISNPAGQLKMVILPDSTKVYLNAASSIAYSNRFGADKRNVILKGEAYFEVVHKADCPFIVASNRLKTQVLGTSFDVKGYDDEPEITIAVTSGKVGVMAGKSVLFLTANQMARFDRKQNKLISRTATEASSQNAWINGDLVFDNQPLEEIARTLSRRYNTTIQIQNNQVARTVLNAHFDKNESLEKVIEVLCAYVDARYKHAGNTYLIR